MPAFGPIRRIAASSMAWRAVAASLPAMVAIACESRAHPPPAPIVRDSAGVRIIAADPAFEPPLWKAAPLPVLDLHGPKIDSAVGTARGGDASFVRIRRVLRMSDGGIVVADDAGPRIVWLSEDGKLRAETGSVLADSGFSAVWPVGLLPGDSLVVADEVMARLAAFDPAGRMVWMRRYPTGQRTTTPWAVFPDGSLLATTAHPAMAAPRTAEPVRDTLVFWSFEPATGDRSEILSRLAATRVPGPEGTLALPWTGNPVFDLDGDDLVVTSGAERVIERWSRAGRLLERDSDGREPRRVTPAMRLLYRQRMSAPGDRAAADSVLRHFAMLPASSAIQAWDRLLVAHDGRTWVRDYEPDREGPALWTVFDPEGGVIARVRTPPGLEIMDITADTLLGVVSEGGMARVLGYRIER